jgi:SET family sugar efflux transporter-like MFS transporter
MAHRFAARVAALLRDPALAPLGLALFLHGLSQGMTVPLIALWIVHVYGGGPGAIAAYFTCAAAGGLAQNPVLGRLSDRIGRRRPTAIAATLLQTAGLAALAARPPFALVLVAAALLLAAQVQPQLFALLNDHVGDGSERLPRALTMATLRATISAAWMFGAPIGGLLAGAGFAWAFGVAAALNASSLVVIVCTCREAPRAAAVRPHAAEAQGREAPAREGRPRWGQLALFGLGGLLAVAGNSAKMQAVPLYLARMGLPDAAIGLTYSWMALGELVLMPPCGWLADRMPRRHVVAAGMLGGTAFFAAIALAPGSAAVVLAFPAIALLIAALSGVGIGYVQDIDPAHAGLAGGVFFAAQGLGQMVGGPLIALSQQRLGLPHAFLIPALAILAGALAVLCTRPAREVARRPGRQPIAVVGAAD